MGEIVGVERKKGREEETIKCMKELNQINIISLQKCLLLFKARVKK